MDRQRCGSQAMHPLRDCLNSCSQARSFTTPPPPQAAAALYASARMASALAASYCGRELRWHLIQDDGDPGCAPDVVFDGDSQDFSPLADGSEELAALLDGVSAWDAVGIVDDLLRLLLQLYAQHQRAKVAALSDERIQFELQMMEALGCDQVLLTAAADGTQQVVFAVPLQLDECDAQQQLLACLQPPLPAAATLGPRAQQQQQQQQFVLHAAFRVGAPASSAAPQLKLAQPHWCDALLPPLALPAWEPHTSLIEFVPEVATRLCQHLADACPAALRRYQLVEGLSALLGPPWEVNMMRPGGASSSAGAGSSSVFGGGGGGGSRGASSAAAAACSSMAAWLVATGDCGPLLLTVEAGGGFPAAPPALALQNLRRSGSDGIVALQKLPWSPRWAVDEMAARIFNYVKQEVPAAMERALL